MTFPSCSHPKLGAPGGGAIALRRRARSLFLAGPLAWVSILTIALSGPAGAQQIVRPKGPPAARSNQPPEGIVRFPDLHTSSTNVVTGWEGMKQVGTIRPPDPH